MHDEARDRVAGVTVLGDFLRPDGRGHPGGVDRPVAWLCTAVRRQIGLAAALPVHLLTPTACPDLADWLSALRPAASADDLWAASFADMREADGGAWGEAIQHRVLSRLRGQFCVGYEMPPYLVRLLDRAAIPWLDIRLHPIRFMDDLLFAVRAAHPRTQTALAALAVPESEVIATAALREAMCQLIGEATVPHGTLVVLGQRRYDCTQIVDGRFFEAADHRADIAEICRRHRAVMLKAHPHDEDHSLLRVARDVAANLFGMVNDNLYRILAMPEVTAVLSVSSSAAYEARYFGKTVYTLGRLPIRLGWRGAALEPDRHAALDDIVLSVDFWRRVLAPHAAVSAMDGMRLAPKPNRLRIALDSFWNFQQIDTDRIPRAA
jgi:hypothetical protein